MYSSSIQQQPKLWAKWESREVFAGFPSVVGKSLFDFSTTRLFHSFSHRMFHHCALYLGVRISRYSLVLQGWVAEGRTGRKRSVNRSGAARSGKAGISFHAIFLP